MNKKKTLISSVVAAGAALGAYIFTDENRRSKINQQFQSMKKKLTKEDDFPIDKAGKPETDHIENADMVSEGSQFGVQYYNEVKTDEKDDK
ncbi:hypothetical protein CEY16_01680 [Halalkalibacillus sediminis]|uniref:Uncharacterized protein n=1 Tax=Halalkalibacillus sediminis TaxID=2018042 RepID=A0A2I0QVX7_9BACI|nr:hypothetical protein [Halalkalibacillus sediminis]PKR78493.1 hypothetical protein CEY16_01680 [Halalkalibacillus sediminis]